MRLGLIVSLGASTTLGLAALIVAKVWMPAHGAQAATAAPVVEGGVPVVTAARPIPYGAKLDAHDLKVIRMPASAAPVGAYASINQILGGPNGAPVALAAMTVQEPVLPADISGPGERLTLAALIGDGQRAFTIAVTEITADGGHVLPGDRVDVVLTREILQPLRPGQAPGTVPRRFVSEVISQNLKVLGMDQNANPSSTQPAVARTATLEVQVEDALKLADAAQIGTLSLALRRPGETEIAQVRPIQTAALASETAAHDPGLRLRHAGAGARADAGPAVIIVQGETRASVPVPSESAAL